MDTRALNDDWGPIAFRGLIGILFGIAAVFWPGLTLKTFVYLFAGFILASGIVSLIGGLSNVYREGTSVLGRILMVALGVLEIGVGIYLLRHTLVSFETLILIVGFTLIAKGLIDAVSGLFESGGAMYKTVMVIAGVLTVLAGIVLLFQPVASGIAFVWILGVYALITGCMQIALAMDVKKYSDNLPERAARRAAR